MSRLDGTTTPPPNSLPATRLRLTGDRVNLTNFMLLFFMKIAGSFLRKHSLPAQFRVRGSLTTLFTESARHIVDARISRGHAERNLP